MAAPPTALQHRFVFGLNVSVSQNCQFIDDTNVVYVAGYNVVLYNVLDRKQRFLHSFSGPEEQCEGFTCLAICPSKRFLAVAEKGEKPLVHFFDLKTLRKRKTVTHENAIGKCEIVAMQFSQDNETLVALCGRPDWSMLAWRWQKARKVHEEKLAETGANEQLHHLSLNPMDTDTVIVAGARRLMGFRLSAENGVQPMRLNYTEMMSDEADITALTWLKHPPDHMVLGNSKGQLGLFQSGVFHCYLAVTLGGGGGSLGGSRHEEVGVSALTATTTGLVVGGTDASFVYLSRAGDGEIGKPSMFQVMQRWQVEGQQAPPIFLAPSPSQDALYAVFKDAQLLRVGIREPSAIRGEEMRPVVSSFHGPAPIRGLDVCVRKPLAVTASADRTIRLWDFQEHQQELCRVFSEEPGAVALHPSGHHLIAAFPDKLKLMNILMDDLRVFREIPMKMCKEVQFANGGHYFAAASASGVVSVFNFYTGERLVDLRGHSNKVKCVFWTEDDSILITCGQDGAVYQWDWEEGKRLGEFVQKAHSYNSALASQDAIFVSGSDLFLKELDPQELQVVKDLDTQVVLSQIALTRSEHLMLAATGVEGTPAMIRAYGFPVGAEFVEYPCLGGAATRLRLSYDDRLLIATDATGCIALMDVKDRQDRTKRSLASMHRDSMPWSEEVLVTRTDLEEKSTQMSELRNKVDELQLHSEYQQRLKDMAYTEKIKEVQEKFMQNVEQEKNKYELLREEKNDAELEFEERLKHMEDRHQHELQDEENTYQEQIMKEVEDYQQLVQERNEQQQRWEQQRATLISTHERYVHELTEDFEAKLEEDKQMRMQLDEELQETVKETREMKNQLEDDIDTEIEHLRDRYETQLNHERELTLRYKGENGIMKKKFTVLQKNIEDQKDEIKTRADKEEDLNVKIKGLESEIKAHKREIKTRDETIGDKEKRIYELKKKNQELEKFKFVLDYKIKELKRQIEPREAEIGTMKGQIKDMDGELEQYHRSNAQLDLLIGDMREKLDEMQHTIVQQRKRIGDYESTVRRFKGDLHKCVQFIQDPEKLKDSMQNLMGEHLQGDIAHDGIDTNVQHEYQRHQDFLERTFQALKDKYAMDTAAHEADTNGVMMANMALIREINTQREQNRTMKQALQTQLAARQRLRLIHGLGPEESRKSAVGGGPEAVRRAMEENKARIAHLREVLQSLESQLQSQQSRPTSREILPPVERNVPQV